MKNANKTELAHFKCTAISIVSVASGCISAVAITALISCAVLGAKSTKKTGQTESKA